MKRVIEDIQLGLPKWKHEDTKEPSKYTIVEIVKRLPVHCIIAGDPPFVILQRGEGTKIRFDLAHKGSDNF